MLYTTKDPGELIFITLVPEASASLDAGVKRSYDELADYLRQENAVLLQERIYAPVQLHDRIRSIRDSIMDGLGEAVDIPATFVEGRPVAPLEWAGIHAIAVVPTGQTDTSLVTRGKDVCGKIFQGSEARLFFLPDVGRLIDPAFVSTPMETAETLRLANQIMRDMDWSYSDVRRTWFYLDNILDWYDEFNQSRNHIYHSIGLFNGHIDGLIPASTGIEGRNPRGAKCTLDVLAIKPIDGHPFAVKRLINPKQNEAPEYGSAFSRGISVALERTNYLFVSGTASIDEHGVSLYPGDMARQVERTLENVDCLLSSAGGRLNHICQATAFVKRAEDMPVYREVAGRMGLDVDKIVCTEADICREELLFELDATAMIPTG